MFEIAANKKFPGFDDFLLPELLSLPERFKLFPMLLQMRLQKQFSFDNCTWNITSKKEGSARVCLLCLYIYFFCISLSFPIYELC